MELSCQQRGIVEAPLEHLSVVACAGSGKTRTAVRRLARIRKKLSENRGYVALLSFSNVAINTFKKDFANIGQLEISGKYRDRVVIETLDSFITTNILRPHAYRTMGCKTTPYLVTGSEAFLSNRNCTFKTEGKGGNQFPVPAKNIGNVTLRYTDGDWGFWYQAKGNLIPVNNGFEVATSLGSMGAYTHELGKYWVLKALLEQEELKRALVNRYPHIIVDEAQDIDFLHRGVLELLSDAGVVITLIGDSNQAIYDFAGADGKFINEFTGNIKSLSKNYRSISKILDVANKVSDRNDESNREQRHDSHGVYYAAYESEKPKELVDSFIRKLNSCGNALEESAVLYRSKAGINKLLGESSNIGQGKTFLLALAAIRRDRDANYYEAFKLVVSCVSALLEGIPDNFSSLVIQGEGESFRSLRQSIWHFVRSSDHGLPASHLDAKTAWHKAVKTQMIQLLESIESRYGFRAIDGIGRNLASTKLPDGPLVMKSELPISDAEKIRVDTVHQAKGESLDAVLYMPTEKKHLREMIQGTDTELGRIGYVALTRARNMFVLGLLRGWVAEFEAQLIGLGLEKLVDN